MQGNLPRRNARLEPGGQQIKPAQFPMQEESIGRRRVPEVTIHPEHHAGIANACREVGVAEVVKPGMTERLAGKRENIQYLLALMVLDVLLEIADVPGGPVHA